jgi:hypothetical protein
MTPSLSCPIKVAGNNTDLVIPGDCLGARCAQDAERTLLDLFLAAPENMYAIE